MKIPDKLTMSHQLYHLGFLTEEELIKDLIYSKRHVPKSILVTYCVIIIPLAYLLKTFPRLLGPLGNFLARKIWIDRAVRKFDEKRVPKKK